MKKKIKREETMTFKEAALDYVMEKRSHIDLGLKIGAALLATSLFIWLLYLGSQT